MRFLGTVLFRVTLVLALLVATSVPAQTTNPIRDIPVTGTFIDDSGSCATFAGTLDIVRFKQSRGVIRAIGRLSGILTDGAGNQTPVSDVRVALPVTNIPEGASTRGDCPILHLELGPLDLDLLGLVVHLDQVVLDITADAGPGNLLGNLLCAIAGLLDGGGTLGQITRLLNRILDILQALP